MKRLWIFPQIVLLWILCPRAIAAEKQTVEGFDKIEFHYPSINDSKQLRDFRGDARGYMTASWWMPGLKDKPNYISWKTAAVPEHQATTFKFVGASSVLPPELARGPKARLSL